MDYTNKGNKMTPTNFCAVYNELRAKSITYIEKLDGHFPFGLSISEMSDIGFVAQYDQMIHGNSCQDSKYVKYDELDISLEKLIAKYNT